MYLKTGDLLYIGLRERKIEFVNEWAFQNGKLLFEFEDIKQERTEMASRRMANMHQRQRRIAASNRLIGHTDAANGVVPLHIAEEAVYDYKKDIVLPTVKKS
ncbi:dihydroxy-acid dehydratase domain protein [Geobacillus kaustophilus]|uniref:Dihydroxy-acid dehydratase domain protein n=1 Tax=Geobacillus kaustophilus TaxID=1462 RepID=A0A0D8BVZ4_GEOKU|nr:dihydroxy-acid dehydratase domain protein [Geobacillus kaustophilus]